MDIRLVGEDLGNGQRLAIPNMSDYSAPEKPFDYSLMRREQQDTHSKEYSAVRSDDQQLRDLAQLFRTRNGFGFLPFTALNTIRKSVAENEYLQGYMQIAKTQVVGAGIHPMFSGVSASGARRMLTEAWSDFIENPTVAGDRDMVTLLEGVLQSLMTDGRVFLQKRYSENFPFGFKLMEIPREFHAELYDDDARRVASGIEYDNLGQIVAYWFHERYNDIVARTKHFSISAFEYTNNPNVGGGSYVRIPAANLIVIDRPARHDTYGAANSWILPMAKIAERVKMINQLEFRNLDSSGRTMGVLKKGRDAVMNPEIERLISANTPEAFKDGGIVQLPMGWELDKVDTGAFPSADVDAMRKAALRAAGTMGHIDYPTFANEPGDANFGSLRAFALLTRDGWARNQQILINRFLKPLYRSWLQINALEGRALMSGGRVTRLSGQALRQASRANFQGRNWPWLDPIKEQQAIALKMQGGLLSPTEAITAEGRDPRDVANGYAEFGRIIAEAGNGNAEDIARGIAFIQSLRPGGPAQSNSENEGSDGDDT